MFLPNIKIYNKLIFQSRTENSRAAKGEESMARSTLGVTATELFACNPYRILGVAVDTPAKQIHDVYTKLLAMAAVGQTDGYKTEYDFDFLPPFTRTEKDLKTAYGKLASLGYKCFAFSDPLFSAPLNIDDVMLNLEDITCYDCFLRCYMWLITNDREFEEPELWVPLCQYIDKLIKSTEKDWPKYFDHRAASDEDEAAALRGFHATFSDLILLPIKELVRGSMKFKSALAILAAAGVDVEEKFEKIDIPQANKPAPGMPAPKLKIAVKDGEEYYDVNTGSMVSFAATSPSAVESNEFAAAASAISADAITADEPEPSVVPKPSVPSPSVPTPSAAAPSEPAAAGAPEEELPPLKHVEEITAPTGRRKVVIPPKDESEPVSEIPRPSGPTPSEPVSAIPRPSVPTPSEPVAEMPKPSVPTPSVPVAETPAPAAVEAAEPEIDPTKAFADGGVSEMRAKGLKIHAPVDMYAKDKDKDKEEMEPVVYKAGASSSSALSGFAVHSGDFDKSKTAAPAAKKPFKKENKGLADLIDMADSATVDAALSEEDEQSLYTDVLIKMLRETRSTKKMESVDTNKVYDNGDAMGSAPVVTQGQEMVSIDTSTMDESRLGASREDLDKETDARKLFEQKYKDVNIKDMINPTLSGKMKGNYSVNTAYADYEKKKKENRSAISTVAGILGFVILLLLIVVFLMWFGLF